MIEDEYRDNEGRIEGRNAVIEALRAGRPIDKIYISKGDIDRTLRFIAAKARDAGIVVKEADRRKLDAMSETHSHQGVIAVAAAHEYVTVEEILQIARDRGEKPFLVICDGISDPYNLGAIIRTAESLISSASAWRRAASVLKSRAEKLSSKTYRSAFFTSALAMERRCFCPPEKFMPPCATGESYP